MPHVTVHHKWAGFKPDEVRNDARQYEIPAWKGYNTFSDGYQELHDKCVAEAVSKLTKPQGVRHEPIFQERRIR